MKAAILVDNMYLEHAARAYGIEYLDIVKLPKILLNEREEHFRTFVFDALPYLSDSPTPPQIERKDKKKRYLDKLQYLELVAVEFGEVRPKSATCRKCGVEFVVPVQKLVDVKISVRLVQLAWSNIVDRIVLVAGDKDLLPAVDAVSTSGATVRLAYAEVGGVGTSKALIRACPEKRLLKQQDLAYCKLSLP